MEDTDDRFWQSQALFTLSYCCILAGDFSSALAAANRLNEFGDATGIRRAQANAAMLAGLSHAMAGDGDKGAELCQRALDVSPDEFESAFILACLGRSHFTAERFEPAVSALEQAVLLAERVRSVQFCAWFRTMLAEAYQSVGALDKAAAAAQVALEASARIRFALGVGLSHQVLGRVAQARGLVPQAEQHLREAISCFAAVGARYELDRAQAVLGALDQGPPYSQAMPS